MANAGGRSKVIEDAVRIGLTIPAEVDDAINALVAMSGGVSKATFVRQALLAGLHPYGLVSPDIAKALAATSYNTRERE